MITLHNAAEDGDVAKITAILKAGDDVNARNQSGATPLHLAAFYGETKAINALLDAGADPKAKDKWGDVAIDMIKETSPIYKSKAWWRLHDANNKGQDHDDIT
ncbi:MAG: ankyrin repeat domain-containing protein [Alphaproteobacteria bacterium]|nr:ankyrin repeat domain-containing protein [Alphaproteobacteria bacterium]